MLHYKQNSSRTHSGPTGYYSFLVHLALIGVVLTPQSSSIAQVKDKVEDVREVKAQITQNTTPAAASCNPLASTGSAGSLAPSQSCKSLLVQFYSGVPIKLSAEGAGNRKLTLGEVQAFTEKALESEHYYIQWLFPTRTETDHNSFAPTLSDADIQEFASNPVLKEKLKKSFNIMLNFYGLKESADGKLHKAEDFKQKAATWLTSEDHHNFLRLSRILESMRILGFNKESQALFDFLRAEIYEKRDNFRINGTKAAIEHSFKFWKAAAAENTEHLAESSGVKLVDKTTKNKLDHYIKSKAAIQKSKGKDSDDDWED